ncbi:MAG: phosphoadenosine phosphosulfate reductase family protein [Candidatus Saliniplasma sp.]
MSLVRLGKLHLHWCNNCNTPLVEEGNCGICSSEGVQVKITPPGDVRPAFESDKELIKNTINRQWGDSYFKRVLGEKEVILLNSSPHLDRMDEVIVDGRVIGNLRYNLYKKAKGKEPYEFLIRPWEGLYEPEKGYIIVDDGAVEPILNGASILAPGIIDVDDDVVKDDEVLILDGEGNVISTGPAQMDAKEMIESDYGKAVKNRWRVSDFTIREKSADWDKVLKANGHLIKNRVENAVDFIKREVEKNDLPPVVAFSGGKDSLATLHLVLDSDVTPDLLFIDTGIELPETIENVKNTADKHDLKLVSKKARSGYWKNVDHFGPSARDYRWCCKTCKLGPTALLIDEEYPGGILSFIGQRRYESKQRMDKGSTWNNPWVPGQEAASPIQDWTALHVWMYLFIKDAEYNPLYEKGFERIGCWLCPASDIAELESLKDRFEKFHKLDKILENYMKKAGLPEIWKELGIWRWREIPENMKKVLDKLGEDYEPNTSSRSSRPSVSEMLDDEKTRNLLQIILPEEEKIKAADITKEKIQDLLDRNRLYVEEIYEIYLKSKYCTECGICVARCPNDALVFDEGISVKSERCDSCRSCLGKCPVVEFDERVIYPE